jgi:DNA topoisomerase-1
MTDGGGAPSEVQDAGLAYVSDQSPGIRRKPARGHGFNYVGPDGKAIGDERTLDRIRALAIPPAWTDVWICPKANGHIQAIGRDAKGRKQYRYHDRWRQVRDSHKYDRIVEFGRALPRLRRRVAEDLARRGLPREKVLAAVVQVMERTLIRVGNEEYARQNKSFGLTTLRNRHVRVGARKAVFEFRGKSGKVHTTGFNDARLARVVKACQDLPGQRLFQYLDETGERRAVESADVNAYIREALGEDFSAKDFRTWAGTVTAAKALTMAQPCASAAETKRAANICVKAVAGLLGNTAAVARGAYIHPAVLDAFEAGRLDIQARDEDRGFELAVLRFLEADKPAKAKSAARITGRRASKPQRRKASPTRTVRGAA